MDRSTTGSSQSASSEALPHGGIFPVASTGSTIDDPDHNYELQDMVTVAESYFERGMIEDADEMLQEALAAGYSQPDALNLNQRIRAILGDSPQSASAVHPHSATDFHQYLSQFTIPLPGADTQPVALQRVLADIEKDIHAGRLNSAYDATLQTLAAAPTFFPIHIRLAELRRALGDDEGADSIVRTLQDCINSWDDSHDWLMLALRVELDPDDTAALFDLARVLLSLRGTVQLEPYVPAAIERAMSEDPNTALELSTLFLQLRQHDDVAARLHLRSVFSVGDEQAIVEAVTRDVGPDASADLLFVRSAIAYAESRDTWFEWLERAVARLLAHAEESQSLNRAVDVTRTMLPSPQHTLATAVIRLAAGDVDGTIDVLSSLQQPRGRITSAAEDMLITACARALALRVRSPIESIEALSDAVSQAVVIDVRDFAESCKLFAQPITAEALMQQLVGVARETGQYELAIRHLQALRDRLPEHLEIRTGLADLQVAAGRIKDGVRELRYIAERYERAGNFERMVEAMRHISNAVPNNAEMKAKLVEGYIQRGIPDEATRELQLLGDLYIARGRSADAADAYKRGAEIAATTGSFRRAMTMFDRAVAADPDNVAVRHAAVAFYIMKGEVDRATQQLREIVRIALGADDPDEAVAALHQIIGLAPTDASAYHQLGEVLTSLGEYAQAERVYRRLAAFTPDDPVLVAKQSALAALAAKD